MAQQSGSKLPTLPPLDNRKRQSVGERERQWETVRQTGGLKLCTLATWRMRNYTYSCLVIVWLCTIDKKTIIGHLATGCGMNSPLPHCILFTRIAHWRLRASCSNFHYNYSICRHLKIHCEKERRMGGGGTVLVGVVCRCNGKCCLYALHNYSCVCTAACNHQGQLAEAFTRRRRRRWC